MSNLRQAAQQALEALEYHVEQTRPIQRTSEVINALRAALLAEREAAAVAEPVAYIHEWKPQASTIGKSLHWRGVSLHGDDMQVTPLYAAPPQREPDKVQCNWCEGVGKTYKVKPGDAGKAKVNRFCCPDCNGTGFVRSTPGQPQREAAAVAEPLTKEQK